MSTPPGSTSSGSSSGDVAPVEDFGDGGGCGLDPARLDRSEDGYPAGPYGALEGDRLGDAEGLNLTDCEGNARDFGEFFDDCNHAIVVQIGAGWSGMVQEGAFELATVHGEYSSSGVEIVQVFYQDWNAQPPPRAFCVEWSTGDWEGEQVDFEAAFPVFVDPISDWTAQYIQDPPSQTPITLVLDANANIRFKAVGVLVTAAELRAELDLVLAEPYGG